VHGRTLTAQRSAGEPGDDLVDVHVALRARAGLPDRQGKLVGKLARGHACRGGRDGIGPGGVQQAEIAVDLGRGALDLGQRLHDRQRHALPADGEEPAAALGLRAPQGIGRHVDGAKAVRLHLVCGHRRQRASLARMSARFTGGSRRADALAKGTVTTIVAGSL
jgi:hypothetical protein